MRSELDAWIDELLDDARRLALSKPPELLRVWEKETPLGDGEVYRSPVTEIDIAVQRRMIEGLCGFLGEDIGIYAEEEGRDDPIALQRPVCVVLDPIDCTRYLIRGNRTYSINLAVIMDGTVTGWVDFPGLGWRFRAGSEGLKLNGEVLRSAPPWPSRLTVAVTPGQAHRVPSHLKDGRELLTLPLGGAACKLAALAVGLAQAVLILPTKDQGYALWDHLPLTVGMRHLGAAVHGLEGDEDLAALRPPLWSGGMIAGTLEVRAWLRAALPDELPRID